MENEEIKAALDALGTKTQDAVGKYEAQVKMFGEATEATRAEVKALDGRLTELNVMLTDVAQKQTSLASSEAAPVSAGLEFVNSEQFKQLAAGQRDKVRLEVKNTVTSDSTTVFPTQLPGIIPGVFAPLTIRSLFRTIPVTTNMIQAIRENAWTSAAAETVQAAAKPESAITFEQINVPISTVAHWIKVSNQLLADAPAIAAYIDVRLRDGLAQRIERQLLVGDGMSPNLVGLTATGNFTVYSPTAGDTLTDAINRAKYLLWASGGTPDAAIVNPADWGAMERLREGVGSGQYLYGMPGFAAGMNPFGVRIVLSQHMPQGSFWVGATSQVAVLYNRAGTAVEMGYVNDDFTKNLITIRAEERLGFGVEAPWAAYYGPFTS